jgi:serine/threonine protein kinase
MAPTTLGPGAVLSQRYRLEDLLEEFAGGRFWRATDTVLARNVAVHVISADDPRAEPLLEAARANVLITDPHLLRVLDCESDENAAWVVHEWGDGLSLDKMLDQGPLSPTRAAWLVRETAQAINAGHAAGLPHGWLIPEQVMVTRAGAVKVIGYATAATLHSNPQADPIHGELDEIQSDVLNLASILYAALTGTWPGVRPSQVPRAPKSGRAFLRARQVRAGIPRMLDSICTRTLDRNHPHGMPLDSAFEIEAALSDFLGDPAKAAPSNLAAMYAEPELHAEDEVEDFLGTGPASAERDAWLEAMAARDDSFGSTSMEPIREPEPFVDSAERPLFADTQRRVPEGVGTTDPANPLPPLRRDRAPEPKPHASNEGRTFSRIGIALLVIIVLVIAGVAALKAYGAELPDSAPAVKVVVATEATGAG